VVFLVGKIFGIQYVNKNRANYSEFERPRHTRPYKSLGNTQHRSYKEGCETFYHFYTITGTNSREWTINRSLTKTIPWCRVLVEKLTVAQLVKKFRKLWNPEVNYRVHNSPSPFPTLSQMNPAYTLPTYF
jgi:hypothetical protein